MRFKVDHQLYATGAGILNTIRSGIKLTEPVGGTALRTAIDSIVSRFPYFLVSIIRDGDNSFEVSYVGRVPWGEQARRSGGRWMKGTP